MSFVRWSCLGAVLLCLAGREVAAAGAGEDNIAVLPLNLSGSLDTGREDLEEAVVKGLVVAGREIISPAEVQGRLADRGGGIQCRTEACWRRLGQTLAAAHLVTGTVEKVERNFRVSLRLLDSAGGREIGSERNECEASDCSLAELVRLSAWELARKTLGPKEPPSGVAVLSPPPPVIPSGLPRAAKPTAESETSLSSEGHRRTPGPLVMSGAGVAAVGAGIALLAVQSCANQKIGCPDKDRHFLAGGLTLGLGAVLLGGGMLWHWREGHPSPDRGLAFDLQMGTRWLAVAGRF